MPQEPFRFRDCECPGGVHPLGDTITFREKLSVRANFAAALSIGSSMQADGAMEVYLYEGPISWNVVDEEGDPVPLTRAALEALPFDQQYEIADHGDTLYSETVVRPLLERARKLSASGPTTGSSRRSARSSRNRSRS